VATVAGKLNRPSGILTILAAVLFVLSNQTIARWMFTFLQLFLHEKVSPNLRLPFRFSGSLNSLMTSLTIKFPDWVTCNKSPYHQQSYDDPGNGGVESFSLNSDPAHRAENHPIDPW
jgi:hypothetical protein